MLAKPQLASQDILLTVGSSYCYHHTNFPSPSRMQWPWESDTFSPVPETNFSFAFSFKISVFVVFLKRAAQALIGPRDKNRI